MLLTSCTLISACAGTPFVKNPEPTTLAASVENVSRTPQAALNRLSLQDDIFLKNFVADPATKIESKKYHKLIKRSVGGNHGYHLNSASNPCNGINAPYRAVFEFTDSTLYLMVTDPARFKELNNMDPCITWEKNGNSVTYFYYGSCDDDYLNLDTRVTQGQPQGWPYGLLGDRVSNAA